MNNKQKLKHLKIKQKRDEFVRIAFSSISPPEVITEKELLKKSGMIVLCILAAFIILLIAFNAKPALAYTGSGNVSDIKANSYINSPMGLFPGTGTTGSASTSARFRWYYGITSTTGTGSTGFFNPGSSTMTAGLPYIDFLFSNGTSTLEFNGFDNVTIDGIAITTGILSDYVKSLNGTTTGLKGTETTLGGTTTIPNTGVFSVNGRVLTDVELSYLDNLSDFLPTLLAGKQTDLAGVYVASLSDDVGTQTGATRLGVSGDLTLVKIGNRFVFGLVGSASTKPDIQEGGTTTTANSGFLNVNASDFDTATQGTGTTLALSSEQRGTTSSAAGYNVKQNGSGKIPSILLSSVSNIQYIGTNTVFTVPEGITTVYITAVSGGGGGATNTNGANTGGGGGGGGIILDYPITVVSEGTYTVSVGLGGIGGVYGPQAGTDGGATSFGILTVTGGTGGTVGGSGGSAGVVTNISNVAYLSSAGGGGSGSNPGGNGGSGFYGIGGSGGTDVSGTDGTGKGSGGGGGGKAGSRNGGNGTDGFCIVKW